MLPIETGADYGSPCDVISGLSSQTQREANTHTNSTCTKPTCKPTTQIQHLTCLDTGKIFVRNLGKTPTHPNQNQPTFNPSPNPQRARARRVFRGSQPRERVVRGAVRGRPPARTPDGAGMRSGRQQRRQQRAARGAGAAGYQKPRVVHGGYAQEAKIAAAAAARRAASRRTEGAARHGERSGGGTAGQRATPIHRDARRGTRRRIERRAQGYGAGARGDGAGSAQFRVCFACRTCADEKFIYRCMVREEAPGIEHPSSATSHMATGRGATLAQYFRRNTASVSSPTHSIAFTLAASMRREHQ